MLCLKSSVCCCNLWMWPSNRLCNFERPVELRPCCVSRERSCSFSLRRACSSSVSSSASRRPNKPDKSKARSNSRSRSACPCRNEPSSSEASMSAARLNSSSSSLRFNFSSALAFATSSSRCWRSICSSEAFSTARLRDWPSSVSLFNIVAASRSSLSASLSSLANPASFSVIVRLRLESSRSKSVRRCRWKANAWSASSSSARQTC
mmetsp:Transcript_173127/g.555121  ORF Transcript_173127/g.555121 Transcript_173127/m.555121 type:complete len:207 (-) Transcript_173127:2155-2775(-)